MRILGSLKTANKNEVKQKLQLDEYTGNEQLDEYTGNDYIIFREEGI